MSTKKEARRESRRIALESLFAFMARNGNVTIQEAFDHVLQEIYEKKEDKFAEKLIKTANENFGKIKVIIRAFAPEFAFEKIAPINRAFLVLGIAEIKFLDTPPIVVINEYIELAKEFGEDKSAGFVNGVLDSYRKHLGLEKKEK